MLLFLCAPTGVMAAEKLRFAFQDRIGSVIPIVAAQNGFFEAEGLEIKPLRFSSGPACGEALYSGAADVATMGDTTGVIMIARDPTFTIIASHATGEHRHRVMVRQDSSLKRLEDLRGKQIAVKKGTSTYGGLLAALDAARIDPADVRIIDLTPPTMTTALLAGSIDAFAASEPTPSVAEEKGTRELTTLGGLGNTYPILLLARRETLKTKQSAMHRFIRALAGAEAYASAHPNETVGIMSAQTGLGPATTRSAMQRHQYRLRLDATILTSLEQSARFLFDQQIITKLPDFAASINPSLLARSASEK